MLFSLPDKNGHVYHIGRGVDIAWKENCVCVCVFLVIYELGGTDFPDLNNRGWCWVSDISRRLDPELTLWIIHFLKLFMAFRMLEIFPPNGTILDVLSAHDSQCAALLASSRPKFNITYPSDRHWHAGSCRLKLDFNIDEDDHPEAMPTSLDVFRVTSNELCWFGLFSSALLHINWRGRSFVCTNRTLDTTLAVRSFAQRRDVRC